MKTYHLAFAHRNPFTLELVTLELLKGYATRTLARAAARRRNRSGKGDKITMITTRTAGESVACCSVN